MRSEIMPAGSRQSDPLSTAAAMIQESWTSLSPNSSRMGLPRMPNISHTANSNVKAMVDRVRTRTRPSADGSVSCCIQFSFINRIVFT